MPACGSAAEDQAAGGSAIIAVNSHSVAIFAVEHRPAGELADARALLEEFDFEAEQHAGLDRLAELHAVDGHEIDELARTGEAEALDREHAGGLRQRLDLQHARHDRPSGEMALEELLVDRHRLDRDDALVRIEAFDPVDEQHRIAMRQRRHHPLDIKRTNGGAAGCRSFALSGPAARCCGAAPERSSEIVGSAVFSAARTSLVTSSDCAAGERRAHLDHDVRAAALHDLLVDRAELVGDLLLNILLVALDLLLLALKLLRALLLLGLERRDRAPSARRPAPCRCSASIAAWIDFCSVWSGAASELSRVW